MNKATKRISLCLTMALILCLCLFLTACSEGNVLAKSVKFENGNVTMVKWDELQLVATVDEKATDKRVSFTSSDESIVKVDEDGIVTSIAPGTATVTVRTLDGSNLSDTCKITVTDDPTRELKRFSVEQDLTLVGLPQTTPQKAITFNRDRTFSVNAYFGSVPFPITYTSEYTIKKGELIFKDEPSDIMVLFVAGQVKTRATVRGNMVVVETYMFGGDNDGSVIASFIIDESTAKANKLDVGEYIPVTGIQKKDGLTYIPGNKNVAVEDLVDIIPANASDKRMTATLNSDTPANVASSNGLTIATGVTDGEIEITVKTVDGNYSVTFTVDVVLSASDYDEKYFDSVPTVGSLESKYKKYGSYDVKTIEKKKITNMTAITAYKIWYPASLENGNEKYPAVVTTNGSNCTYADCEPVYRHLATWGFIVIGNNDTQSIAGTSSLECVQVLQELNADSTSPLYNKIDMLKIGLQGGSQGGAGAIHAATSNSEYNIFASMMTLSAAQSGTAGNKDWEYDLSGLTIPYFMVAGTGQYDNEIVAPLASLNSNYAACNGITIMARRKDCDHPQIANYADGYLTAWFLYTLKGDAEAKKVFYGENAELFNNPNWQDVKGKNI